MARLLVTGASGYIGERLCEVATQQGYEVVVLGSSPSHGSVMRRFRWNLGEEPDPAAFFGIDALIHLSHSWSSDAKYGTDSANINLLGSTTLARAALANKVPRFVFASTISARPDALNSYGRIKYALEGQLAALPGAAGRIACARIGLVYGGREAGLYGLLSKLVRTTPVMPMVGLGRKVQPIYLDEVVAGLLTLATKPLPGNVSSHTVILAGPKPVTFKYWLRLLRRAHTGNRIFFLPIPLWVALLGCDLTRFVPFVPTVDRERILGLAGTTPMDSKRDVEALGLEIVPPVRRLVSLRMERKQIIAEARAMLCYVSGKPTPPRGAIRRLVRGIEHQDAEALRLPRVVTKYPVLLRAFEPCWPRTQHRLAQRLHLAVMVVESERFEKRQSVLALMGQIILEAIALPCRLALSRCYA